MNNPAYFVFDVAISNPEGMLPYQQKVGQTLAPYGGTVLVLAGNIAVFEGEGPQGFSVIVQFPDINAAKAWYHSEQYQQIIGYRHSAASTNAYLLDGIGQA